MVVKVALWYELWPSLMNLCWIIFLFSDHITEQALILLHIDEMKEAPKERNALANHTDDVIVEILRHLLARSLFYCTCVCRSWNHLIKDYNNHKVRPRTSAGFLYDIDQGHRRYTSVTGEHPSLSFFPFTLDNVAILDICNGLIYDSVEGLMDYTAMSSQSGNQEVQGTAA
jgi:hypothetical protein